MITDAFYQLKKLFSFIKHLNFCLDVFTLVGRSPNKKARKNFKIYDVTTWETNNYNTYIAHL